MYGYPVYSTHITAAHSKCSPNLHIQNSRQMVDHQNVRTCYQVLAGDLETRDLHILHNNEDVYRLLR